MTELLNAEFEDETGTTRRLTRDGDPHVRDRHRGRRQRDDHAPDRLGRQGAGRAPRPAARARRGSDAHPERDRGAPPVRAARTARGALRRARRRALRPDGARRQRHAVPRRRRRTATTGATRTATGSTSTATSDGTSRSVSAPTSASAPRSARLEGRVALEEVLKRFPEWDVDRAERQALPDLDRARVGDASGRHAVTPSEQTRERRPYDSPVRRQRAAETRERIIAAGAELLHGFPVWNWRALTVRSVAERARVNRAHGVPPLRERARAARRGDGAPRTGVRRRARRARTRRHQAPHRTDPRVRVVVPARVAHTGRPDSARRAPSPT